MIPIVIDHRTDVNSSAQNDFDEYLKPAGGSLCIICIYNHQPDMPALMMIKPFRSTGIAIPAQKEPQMRSATIIIVRKVNVIISRRPLPHRYQKRQCHNRRFGLILIIWLPGHQP